jgi:FlaA1/EpsC-like NDP-sugar epimerase
MNLSLRISERKTLLLAIDLFLVNMTTLFALWVWTVRGGLSFNREFIFAQIEWFFFLSFLWIIASFLSGLYDLVRITNLVDSASALAQTIVLMMLAYLAVYFFLAEPGALPRGIVLYQGASSFVLIGLWRALFMSLIRGSAFARKVIIVGAGNTGTQIAELISQHAPGHYQIAGFIDDDPDKFGKTVRIRRNGDHRFELPVLGSARDLVRCVKENDVPEVILAITRDFSRSLFDALLECKVQGVEITLMPILFEQLTGQVPIDHIGNNWNVALPLETAEAGGWYPIGKRLFDIVGALIGLTLFLPLFPFLALAIKLDSPGPVFYSHTRSGKGAIVQINQVADNDRRCREKWRQASPGK